MGDTHEIYPWGNALVRRSLDGEEFWVGCGFFSWGGGGGEEDSSGQVLQSRFDRRRVGSNSPIFLCYILYSSWDSSTTLFHTLKRFVISVIFLV